MRMMQDESRLGLVSKRASEVEAPVINYPQVDEQKSHAKSREKLLHYLEGEKAGGSNTGLKDEAFDGFLRERGGRGAGSPHCEGCII